mgnify:CR=1 FL=1
MHIAILAGNQEVISALMKKGYSSDSHLWDAIKNKDTNAVLAMTRGGADLNKVLYCKHIKLGACSVSESPLSELREGF